MAYGLAHRVHGVLFNDPGTAIASTYWCPTERQLLYVVTHGHNVSCAKHSSGLWRGMCNPFALFAAALGHSWRV